MGFVMNLCGVCTSLVIGILLSKHRKYLTTARMLIASGVIVMILATLTFKVDKKSLVFINMVLLSMCTIPIIPLSIGFSAELGFPHEEAITNGFLLMCGQATSFVMALMTLPLVVISSEVGVLFLLMWILIAFGISIVIVEDLKRTRHELHTQNRKSVVSSYSGIAFSTKFF